MSQFTVLSHDTLRVAAMACQLADPNSIYRHQPPGSEILRLEDVEYRLKLVRQAGEAPMVAHLHKFSYVAIPAEGFFGVGRADEGVPGYTLMKSTPPLKSMEIAQAEANRMNEALGIPKEEVYRIIATTMARPAVPQYVKEAISDFLKHIGVKDGEEVVGEDVMDAIDGGAWNDEWIYAFEDKLSKLVEIVS